MTDDVYRDLTADEENAFCLYLDEHDSTELEKIILNNRMSADMARFVADVIAGRAKQRPGRPSNDLMNMQIFNRIESLLSEGYTLRGGSNKEGAAVKVAEEFRIFAGEDAVIKAHQKISAAMKEAVKDVCMEKIDSVVSMI